VGGPDNLADGWGMWVRELEVLWYDWRGTDGPSTILAMSSPVTVFG